VGLIYVAVDFFGLLAQANATLRLSSDYIVFGNNGRNWEVTKDLQI
jgi:hypothetical protein